MGLFDESYENRLKFLNMESLKNRGDIQGIKMFFKVCYKFNRINTQWFNEIEIIESLRHRLLTKTEYNRLIISYKYFFNY